MKFNFVQEIIQCKFTLERTNSNLKQQENLGSVLIERNEDMEQSIQQHQRDLLQLDLELMNLEDAFISRKPSISLFFLPSEDHNFISAF